MEVRGSSPLARGLPAPIRSMRGMGGIIPARAGFTGRSPPCCTAPADHPRSRGVYPGRDRTIVGELGSSPLARGLRRLPLWGLALVRIIPARAGFTSRRPVTRRRRRDHPRSRGVYIAADARVDFYPGSSPLARGLPMGDGGGQSFVGIIPARAGFTRRPHPRREAHRDHPRSRGVYSPHAGGRPRTRGSSPLARGLRPGPGGHPQPHWIIPARAGFTARTPATAANARDHPRSRGVYRPARRSAARR